MEEPYYNRPWAIAWSPMAAAERQVRHEAFEYAKTVSEDPAYIRARALIIAEQAFGLLSKRIKESPTYDDVLATIFLSSARSEFLSLIGSFQRDIADILKERAKPIDQQQTPTPDTPSPPSSPHEDLLSDS